MVIKSIYYKIEIFSEMDEDELGGITFEYFLAILN